MLGVLVPIPYTERPYVDTSGATLAPPPPKKGIFYASKMVKLEAVTLERTYTAPVGM